MTQVVWVLVMFMSQVNQGGPVVIDNISSQQNCIALGRLIEADDLTAQMTFSCHMVRKVK